MLEDIARVASSVARYEKVAVKKGDADHQRLRTSLIELCSNLMIALAKSIHKNASLRFFSRIFRRRGDLSKNIQDFETIKRLDDSCKEHVVSIHALDLVAAGIDL